MAVVQPCHGSAWVVLFMCTLLVGCTRSSPANRGQAGTYRGAIRQTQVHLDGSLQLEPPGSRTPRIDWQQAVARCADGRCDIGSAPEVVLALATTPDSGHLRSDGSTKPSTDHVLSYVLISRHRQCVSSGGPAPAPGRPAAGATVEDCDKIQLINADTGHIGYSEEGAY